MQKVTWVRVVGCDLCGVVQHLHQVLLVGAARLPGRSVARAAPEGVPGLEVLRLCLLIGLLAGVSLSLLLLHLAAELSPVLLLVFLDTKSASSPLTHTDLAVPRLDRLLGGVLGDVRAGQPRVLHVARHRVLARIPSRLGLDQRSQLQSDLPQHISVSVGASLLLTSLVMFLCSSSLLFSISAISLFSASFSPFLTSNCLFLGSAEELQPYQSSVFMENLAS